MDLKERVHDCIKDGLVRVQEEREASRRFHSGWESKKREISGVFVEVAKELQKYPWCEAGVRGEDLFSTLSVEVDPRQIAGQVDLADKVASYSLVFRADPQVRRINCRTIPENLLEGVVQDLHPRHRSMSFGLDDLEPSNVEARVGHFVAGIMRDLERRAVR